MYVGCLRVVGPADKNRKPKKDQAARSANKKDQRKRATRVILLSPFRNGVYYSNNFFFLLQRV